MPEGEEYPSEEELQKIREWPAQDPRGLVAFVRPLWHMADWGWHEEPGRGRHALTHGKYTVLHLSTAGWSGNESLIGAMGANFLFWGLCWCSARRGGHYELHVPDWTGA